MQRTWTYWCDGCYDFKASFGEMYGDKVDVKGIVRNFNLLIKFILL